MKIHRFIGDFDLTQKRLTLVERSLVHQIRTVLKLKSGEIMVLGDGRGQDGQCRILSVGPKSVEIEIVKTVRNLNEPLIHAVLFCAVLKKENFALVVQKATEVGVSEIVPVISRRTIKMDVNVERLSAIAKEAAEQSGRGRVPLVHEPMSFKEALKVAAPNGANYFFEIDALPFDKGVLKMKGMDRVGLFIGTEGGWDEEEVGLAKTNYFHVASLGTAVLRAETAAIIASYLITSADVQVA